MMSLIVQDNILIGFTMDDRGQSWVSILIISAGLPTASNYIGNIVDSPTLLMSTNILIVEYTSSDVSLMYNMTMV